MREAEFVCIVCPKGCHIKVVETEAGLEVTGNTCLRGEKHARNEFVNPMRMLTSTVKLIGGVNRRIPVISTAEVPKNKLVECLDALRTVEARCPVNSGDVLVSDICGCGVDVVAAMTVK